MPNAFPYKAIASDFPLDVSCFLDSLHFFVMCALKIEWEFPNLVVSNLVVSSLVVSNLVVSNLAVSNFYAEALFCALFALFCGLVFALFCALLCGLEQPRWELQN